MAAPQAVAKRQTRPWATVAATRLLILQAAVRQPPWITAMQVQAMGFQPTTRTTVTMTTMMTRGGSGSSRSSGSKGKSIRNATKSSCTIGYQRSSSREKERAWVRRVATMRGLRAHLGIKVKVGDAGCHPHQQLLPRTTLHTLYDPCKHNSNSTPLSIKTWNSDSLQACGSGNSNQREKKGNALKKQKWGGGQER